MSLQILRNFTDTFVSELEPNKNFGSGSRIRLDSAGANQKFGYMFWGQPFPAGATILSAKLHLFLGVSLSGSQTLNVQINGSPWSLNNVTWNTRPGSQGTIYSVTQVSPNIYSEWVVDLTPMMQTVADGFPWFGVKLSMAVTGATTPNFFSSQSAQTNYRPWVEISWSDAPEPPADLFPSGGRAIPAQKPILRFSFTDVSGSTSINAANVQFSATNNFAAPDHDTGWILVATPQVDTASQTTWAGLADGAGTWWRVRVRDGAGLESGWSQSAYFIRYNISEVTPLVPGTSLTVLAKNEIINPKFRSTLGDAEVIPDASTVLSGIRTKLTNANTTPVLIHVGPTDSIGEGGFVKDWRKSWIGQLVDKLAAKYSPGNYAQWADLVNTEQATNFPYTFEGTPVVNNTYGPGLQSLELDGSADKIKLKLPDGVTAIQIWAKGATDTSLGVYRYDYDGSAGVNVNTGSRVNANEFPTFLVPPGTVDTVNISWQSGNKVIITGVFLYWGNTSKGVWIIENGEGGRKASDYVANTNWSNQLDVVDPHLIIMPIGTNDFFQGQSIATIKTNIQTIITHMMSKLTDASTPIILLPYWEPMQIAQIENFDAMRKMYAELGTANANVTVFDGLQRLFGPYVGDDHNGAISSDLIHPNEYGHTLMADSVYRFLIGEYTRGGGLISENLCTNPSFQVGTTGYTFAANDTATRTRGATPYEWSGTHYLKINKPATTGDNNQIFDYAFTAPHAGAYRISVDVRAPVVPDVIPALTLTNYTSGAVLATIAAYPAGVSNTKVRLIYDYFIAAGDLVGTIRLRGHQPGTTQEWHVDGFCIEESALADGVYFDGDSKDDNANLIKNTWTDEVHGGTSKKWGKAPAGYLAAVSGSGIARCWQQTYPIAGMKYRLSTSLAAYVYHNTYSIPVVAGNTMRVKCKWRVQKGTGTPTISVAFFNAALAQVGSTINGPARSLGFEGEENFTALVPATAVWMVVYTPIMNAGESEGLIESLMVTLSTYNGVYFDGAVGLSYGDGLVYAWQATPDYSTSAAYQAPYFSSYAPRLAWSFLNQWAYQIYVIDPNDGYRILYDSGKVVSTVQSATIPPGVMLNEDAFYMVWVRCWDSIPREHVPGYPVFADNIRYIQFSHLSPFVPPVDTIDVLPAPPYPFVDVTWTRARPAEGFEIYRAVNTDMQFRLIAAGTPQQFTQLSNGTFTFRDTTVPLRTPCTWKVYPIENEQGSQVGNPTDVAEARTLAPMLSELDGSDPVFFLNPERDMELSDTAEVYQPIGDAPPVMITQEARNRRYSGTLAGRLTWDAIPGVSGIEMKNRFERLSRSPGRLLRLTILNEQLTVFIKDPTWQPRSNNEGIWYEAKFSFYQVSNLEVGYQAFVNGGTD